MKKVIVLFAVIIAFAANSFAQNATQTDNQTAPLKEKVGKHNKGDKGKHAGAIDMKKDLNLSSDQETRMKNIGSTYKGKMQALRSDNTLDKNQKRVQMVEMQKAHEAEVKGVLNSEQYTKFTEMKKQRHDKMKAHKGEHKGKKQGEAKTEPKSN